MFAVPAMIWRKPRAFFPRLVTISVQIWSEAKSQMGLSCSSMRAKGLLILKPAWSSVCAMSAIGVTLFVAEATVRLARVARTRRGRNVACFLATANKWRPEP